MQRFKRNAFSYLSYITAAGDEIVLSCENYRKWWECYGRKGFKAPELEYVKRDYADGTTDVLAVKAKPRELTVQMVVIGDTIYDKDQILSDIASRLIQLGTKKNWGKLKIQRSDGAFVYIDCVYTGGLDAISEDIPLVQQFELNFYSGNGYFYDENETLLSTAKLTNLVYLSDNLYLSDDLYLTDGVTSIDINNAGEVFYPVVDIFGPASVIRATNNTTGKTMAVEPDFTLLAGQKLTFDCREHERAIIFTDTAGNETDVTQRLLLGSSLVWEIAKGYNSITFYYTDSSEETFARIRYRQRYFSV